MNGQLPPQDSIAAALLVVGVLFAVRYLLAIRRLVQEAPRPAGFSALRPPKAGDFGDDLEPNRRYAARQYWQAAVFLAGGIGLFGWLLAAGTPITLGQGA